VRLILILSLTTAAPLWGQQQSASSPGEALYKAYCAACHDTGFGGRAPARAALGKMSADRIYESMNTGAMTAQAGLVSMPQRQVIAEFLSGAKIGSDRSEEIAAAAFCAGAPGQMPADPLSKPHWNGWGVDETNDRFQPAAMARLAASDVGKLKLKWAFGYPGDVMAYAQPTVVGGRIFVGSAGRRVYSLDAKSGCIYWVYRAEAFVRSAITVENGTAYFGDGRANVYGVNASTGAEVWKTRVEAHPEARITGAVKFHDGRLYAPVSSFEEGTGGNPMYECCTFRGSVVALDAKSGKVVWKTYTIDEEAKPTKKNAAGTQLRGPSGAAVWSSPTIDSKNKVVYVATGDNYSEPASGMTDSIIAMDLETGKIVWFRQMTAGDVWNFACGLGLKSLGVSEINCPNQEAPDSDFGSSPVLVSLGGGKRALIAGQKSAAVYALDPDKKGAIVWQTKLGKGGKVGGVQWGPAVDGEKAYVAISDAGVQFAPDEKVGMAAALDPKVGGGLFALRLSDGEKLWYTKPGECGDRRPCSPAQSQAVTAIPGVVFSGSLDGHFRAYSAKDGKVIWDFDTFREFDTVNKVAARGGGMDGPGATVVDGTVYVNSGYAFTGGGPGNVLLAFSVDGK
jgi:polyvinyl alcohol dehydrogenase (cytochrome)